VCHGDSYRGAPFFAVQCGTNVKVEGSNKVKMYTSTPWACRGFALSAVRIYSLNSIKAVITV
jgi:hypothetical protein